jgi:hypothetical protein
VNDTVAVLEPVAVAVPTVGAPATVNGIAELLAVLAALIPAELVAVTVKVYEVPLAKPETVIVPEPACETAPVKPPGEDVAV